MSIQIYNPFLNFDFSDENCFLTGKKIQPDDTIQVFPQWIIDRYSLHDQNITMLGQNVVKYPQLKLPCAPEVAKLFINPLEDEIQKAFCAGYQEVIKVPEIRLFQWMAKLVYGILYNDIAYAKRLHTARGKEFHLSSLLTQKFRNLNAMLQSLLFPMEFKPVNPWSIKVVEVKYSKDVFNYKDETNNLNFSLGMNGFGIVACLQDNGENLQFHSQMLEKISGKKLHAVQFEELCAQFLYSNYLLDNSKDYKIDISENKVVVTLSESNNTTVFKPWEDKMFAQVLANYWKPWGLTMEDIISFPDSPISYLINDYNNEFIEPDSITLPF